jgi:hypothetical protein
MQKLFLLCMMAGVLALAGTICGADESTATGPSRLRCNKPDMPPVGCTMGAGQ